MNQRQIQLEQIRQQSIQKRTQVLKEAVQKQAMHAPINGAVSSGGANRFNVPVESSIVADASVIIGWTSPFRYTDKDGQVYRIAQSDVALEGEIYVNSIIEVVQTNQLGIASFSSFNNQWKIDDYTEYYAKNATGPETFYAPIQTYGGTAVGAGYDVSPMQSNAGLARVNPITSLLTTVNKYRLPNDTGVSDLIVSRVEEWINTSLTTDQKENIKIGIADPSVYNQLIQPTQKIKDLFSGLSITDQPYYVELATTEDTTLVETTLSSITSINIAATYSFATYYNERNSGGSRATADQWAKDNITTSVVGTALGYEVEEAPKRAIINLLYDNNATRADFAQLTTTYPSLLQKTGDKDEPKVPGFLANIYEASTTSGLRSYTVGEDVVEEDGKLQVGLIFKGERGSESFFPATVTKNSDKDYTLDVLTTTGLGYFRDGVYTIEVVLTTSKTQTSNSVVYDTKTNKFTDTVTGAAIDPLKDSEPPKSGNNISAYLVSPAKTVTLAETGTINKNPAYYVNDGIIGDLYVYWTGDRWVADNDNDPKEVYAFGPKDGSLTGDYIDRNSEIQMQVSMSK